MQSMENPVPSLTKSDAVITCFLSMILLLLMALVSVSLESARSAAARFLVESYTRMAANSVMAGYGSSLFDRYHLFAVNTHTEGEENISFALKAETEHYLDRNLNNDTKTLWSPQMTEVEVEGFTQLTDDGARVFREQAVEYMKYRGVTWIVENLLSSLGLFQNAQKTVKLLETKASTEESVAQIDRLVLELFESVDGFTRDKDGIKKNLWGKIKTKDYFVKKLLNVEPNPETTQINHPTLFDAIKEKYVNPLTMLDELEENLDRRMVLETEREELIGEIEERLFTENELTKQIFEMEALEDSVKNQVDYVEREEKRVKAEMKHQKKENEKEGSEEKGQDYFEEEQNQALFLEQEQSKLQEQKAILEGQKEALKESKKVSQQEKKGVEKERKELEANLRAKTKEIEKEEKAYAETIKEWNKIIDGCFTADKSALGTIEKIKQKQEIAKSKVFQYERELSEAQTWLDSTLLMDLKKDIALLKQYVNVDTKGEERIIDLETMGETLLFDGQILSKLSKETQEGSSFGVIGDKERLSTMRSLFLQYHHKGLCFDYSGLKLEAEGKSPVKEAGSLMKKGLTSLVIQDTDNISKKKISDTDLPSDWYFSELLLQKENKGKTPTDALDFEKIEDSGASSSLASVGNQGPFAQIGQWFTKAADEVTSKTLFLSYLLDHFASYQQKSNLSSELAYEQEYILCGDHSDEENLGNVIGRLLLVRLIFNLIHVLSDSEKGALARETATGLLGITGLPILISLLKFVILFVWATEGALVEVSALMQGKKIALMPSKEEYPVAFGELLLMTKARIYEKGGEMKSKTMLAFGYQEYLALFLLLQDDEKQSMYALDLIQKNIAMEEGGFRIRHLVSSFLVKVDYMLPEVFTKFAFSKRKTGGIVFRTKALAL